MCTYKIKIPKQAYLIETCDNLFDRSIDFNHIFIIESCHTINSISLTYTTKRLVFGRKEYKIKKYHA